MRVIFLDFDGVLNSHKWQTTRQHPNLAFDPHTIDLLNGLVEAADAKVVFSTSHRHWTTIEALAGALEWYGFYARTQHGLPRVIGKTADYVPGAAERGDEVKAWLDENAGVSEWVCLDDDNDFSCMPDRLVQTSYEVGLTPEDVHKALRVLKVP